MAGFRSTNPTVPLETQRDTRRLQGQVGAIESRVAALESTKHAVPTPHDLRNALQSNGAAPLTVTALPGMLAQPQWAKVLRVSAFPPPADPRVVDGFLVLLDGIVYRFDAPTMSWIALGGGVALQPIVQNPTPIVPPGPGTLCTTPTNMANSVCYSQSSLGSRNVQSFFWFQQQITVGAGNPWDFGCLSGAVFFWPQVSQMLIINGIPSPQPSWPANWQTFGFIAAGFPPYDPIGAYFIHSLSICGGFDG